MGSWSGGETNLYEVTKVLEKPTPTLAEQELIIAGLRAGYYLCFFGMHVLTPKVMDLLAEMEATRGDADSLHNASRRQVPGIQFSAALAQLAQQEKYLALHLSGTRYNIGVKYGLLMAQLALALHGQDRDAILSELVELLAAGSISRN